MIDQPADELPAGFARGPQGLLIPAGAGDREREVWTREEAKTFLRAMRLAREKHILLMLGCNDRRCAEMPVIREEPVPGGYQLVCTHKVRVVYVGG